MSYRSIVISSPSRISVSNARLVVEGERRGSIPIEDIRTLMIESRDSTITTYALSLLSDAGVCVYLCDDKHLPSAIIQPMGRHSRQLKQISSQMSQAKPRLKRMWQDIVITKITNQAICLKLCRGETESYARLVNLSKNVQSGDPTNVEGHAAAIYFSDLFGKGFHRGDESTINASLNYGYAIVRGYVARTVASYGYEPCIGIHHHSELNNYNMADDLIEPFRPLVDLFVYYNLDDGEMSPAKKRELCNVLNYEMLSGGERHSVAYSIERLVHSLERCFRGEDGARLMLPTIESLKRHEYE